jgi:hypothetical protein
MTDFGTVSMLLATLMVGAPSRQSTTFLTGESGSFATLLETDETAAEMGNSRTSYNVFPMSR